MRSISTKVKNTTYSYCTTHKHAIPAASGASHKFWGKLSTPGVYSYAVRHPLASILGSFPSKSSRSDPLPHKSLLSIVASLFLGHIAIIGFHLIAAA